MTAGGVPPWARPVLEALVELAYAPLDNEQTAAAWNRIGEACEAALVSDAGTPEGAQCAMCGALLGEGEARCFTVCEPCWDQQYRSAAPTTNAPEISTALVHAAPDRKEK